MPQKILPMWRSVPADIAHRIENCLDAAIEKQPDPVSIFFRADDAAVPGPAFFRLTEMFVRHRMPLNIAVVPAWITKPRWRTLRRPTEGGANLFCWHQHGWRHLNHEPAGKKQEFGPARSRFQVAADLQRGKSRLECIMGNHFYPVFTPPWNRCGSDTLAILHAMKYKAVSRNRGSHPKPPEGLMEIPVSVDLHTLKIGPPAAAWERLLWDLERAVAGGVCGIMIHHRVMTAAAFGFLDTLLQTIAARQRLTPLTFRDLVKRKGRT